MITINKENLGLFATNVVCVFILGALAYALLFGPETPPTTRASSQAVEGFYFCCMAFIYLIMIYFLLMINAKEGERK